MKKQEIAKICYEIADFLQMEGVAFKPFAWRKVAEVLETMEEDADDIYKKGGIEALEGITGVGKSIAQNIEEYLKTGRMRYWERLKKKTPVDMDELTRVEGLGPRKVKVLYQKLEIRNLKDLERAAKAHKIRPLFGFGEKTEKNILQGIEFLKRSKGRFLLGEILPRAKEVLEKLKKLPEVEKIDMAGSLRRMKETIGDVDFLAIAKKGSAAKIMDFFVSLPGVARVWAKGGTKASVRFKEGFDMDIRVLQPKSYGSALQYFTGSKEHNIALRRIAMDKGFKLSEYGLFRGSKMIAGHTEEEIYKALGLQWLAPELREDQGGLKAALENKLPQIIDYRDIKGDLHVHSDWDGGENSIEELARWAQKMGYEYLGISDHTKALHIEHGLDEAKIIQRNKEIDKLNEKLKMKNETPTPKGWGSDRSVGEFKILKGVEANIMKDGSIDIRDDVLAQLDFVIAGIHSNMKIDRQSMTERMIKAMKNPNVDIISHPTGRILKKRDEYQIDFDAVLRAAKETGTILEISAWPERLDLNDQNIRKAKEAGVKMIINTDSHNKNQLHLMEFGVAQARRGWAAKEDIINYWPLEKLLTYFK